MKHFIKPRVTATAQGDSYEFNVSIRANSEFELGVCAQLIQRMKDILIKDEIQRKGLKDLYQFATEEDERNFYEIVEMNIWDDLLAQGEVVRDLGRRGYKDMDGTINSILKPE
ncbi:hypothetical protein AVL50_26065 [Flammeovirga sp. SJP92]|nr:hypothetical protein [Flammeovirga aprica]KXX67536.1 hypothetical protein AVL50_26065 [Flammeovirga sp. SJP92]